MISNIMQIGDCNAVATYQTLINHLFSQYIGVFCCCSLTKCIYGGVKEAKGYSELWESVTTIQHIYV